MYFLLNLAVASAACAASSAKPSGTQAAAPVSTQAVKPPTTPGNAPIVPQDFVGFGLESAFLPNFDNDFSGNLVSSLADRLGKPPVMRVGGTSGDYFLYNPQQKEARTCRIGPCDSSTGKFTLGPSFFKSYERFKDAKTTIQAPLENPVNISNTLDYVASAWRHLDNGKRVATIALGNEVEYIYKGNSAQPYVTAALKLQDAIVKNLSLSGDAAKIFEVGNIASGSVEKNTAYHIDDILNAGIDKNGRVAATAEHWYQIMDKLAWTDATMQQLMTNHSAITTRFSKYAPSLKASQAHKIPYAIDEDAAVLGGAPITFASGFGFALWAVDFNLVAMSRGVARVNNLAARPSADRAFWCPDDSAAPKSPGPQVRAPYPAAIFAADFLGKTDTAVAEIATNKDLLSAYAAYEGNKLQRVALVNMRLYNGTKTENRGKVSFDVSVGDVDSVKVRRLHADLGVAAMGYDFAGPKANISWAGQQWSYKLDGGKGHYTNGQAEESTVKVVKGVATVEVPDSEAVMVIV